MDPTTRHNILLIEDSENDALLMQRALRKSTVTDCVHIARSGKDALEYMKGVGQFGNRREFPLPQLILLDLQMPEMHGLKVLEWIRSQPQFRSTVVIVLSSSRLLGDIQLAYKLGSNSYLVKPPTLEMLYQTVSAIALYWLSLNQWPEDALSAPPFSVGPVAAQTLETSPATA
jgi:CheY-like chemotaxis protein